MGGTDSSEKIFIVGAGTMGISIAQVFAQSGIHVAVCDISDYAIKNAATRLDNGLDKLIAKGKLDVDGKNAIISKFGFTTEISAGADADLVVEAVAEKLEIKQDIFTKLDAICKPETIFASNTSSISITAIASSTQRPDRFIGMHFFNPATVMKLVEVIRGASTSDETTDKIKEMVAVIGKEAVEVNEAPGFVVNRILIPMINEAVYLLESGVANADGIDTAMKLGANHPMGPLALGDLIGLDICLAIMDVLLAETGDNKYRACPLLRKMVRSGKLGKKTGSGFFNYNN